MPCDAALCYGLANQYTNAMVCHLRLVYTIRLVSTAQQRYVHTTKFCYDGMFRICLWRRLAARLIHLGIVRGVGRHESPQRLKNHDYHELKTYNIEYEKTF